MKIDVRQLAVALLLLALLGGAWHFGFGRVRAERARLDAGVAEKERLLALARGAGLTLAELERRAAELSAQLARFDAKLPRERDVQGLLDRVWRLAEAHGLSADRVRTLKAEPGAGHVEQPVEVSLSGDFVGFYKFVIELEQLARITRVLRMDLAKIDKGAEGRMTAQLGLSVYYAPAE